MWFAGKIVRMSPTPVKEKPRSNMRAEATGARERFSVSEHRQQLVFAIAVLLFVLLLATVLVFAMRELSHRRTDAADASTIRCLSEDLTPIERQVLYTLPRDTRLRLFVGR